MKIATLERLTAWLEEEDWFDEGQIFSYRPEPASVVPTRVELEIGRWVEGGLDPGDVMTFRVFRLLATGVTHFSIESPGHFPGTWSSDGVELDEDGLGLTISIVTPGLLRLTFHNLEVVQLDDRRIVVEPWVSDHSIWVSADDTGMPSAEDWIQLVRGAGVNARWNICDCDQSAANDPAPLGYDGWCLQLWEQANLEQALFIDCRQGESAGYSLSIERGGVPGRLWDAVRQATAADPSAVIRAGNVEMKASQWSRYLDDGTLPDAPRGWSIPPHPSQVWEVVDGRERPRRAASHERPRGS